MEPKIIRGLKIYFILLFLPFTMLFPSNITGSNLVSFTAPQALNEREIRNGIEYPVSCRRAGLEGSVLTKILVDQNGRVKKIVVLCSPHIQMTLECLSKLEALVFVPAQKEGIAIMAWTEFEVCFQLDRV